MFDAWTSAACDPYLAVTAHYVHSNASTPNDRELHSKVLGYTEINGNHSGANMAAVILRIVDRYGIRGQVCIISFICLVCMCSLTSIKLGWATSDNATSNDKAMCVL